MTPPGHGGSFLSRRRFLLGAAGVGAISSPAVVVKVVRCLREVGIPARDIILFERYADEFEEAGYIDLVERELPGVRWLASAVRYTDSQLDITGFDQGRDST